MEARSDGGLPIRMEREKPAGRSAGLRVGLWPLHRPEGDGRRSCAKTARERSSHLSDDARRPPLPPDHPVIPTFPERVPQTIKRGALPFLAAPWNTQRSAIQVSWFRNSAWEP